MDGFVAVDVTMHNRIHRDTFILNPENIPGDWENNIESEGQRRKKLLEHNNLYLQTTSFEHIQYSLSSLPNNITELDNNLNLTTKMKLLHCINNYSYFLFSIAESCQTDPLRLFLSCNNGFCGHFEHKPAIDSATTALVLLNFLKF